ncbi:MAG: FG-GAP-like repeat-containing protein, partial [Planctomycetota bacterium]
IVSGGSGGVQDFLFINNGDGTFTDMAASSGISQPHKGKGVAVADVDGDGDLDMYVTSAGPANGSSQPGNNKLYMNDGTGAFIDRAVTAGVNAPNPTEEDSWSTSFGDYDGDGDLDMLVGGFLNGNQGTRLYRNNGTGSFHDVSGTTFTSVPAMACFSPSLVDMDGDWQPDMIMVSDFDTSRYFKAEGDGTFTEWTSQANAGQEENGMGLTVGDFNADGLLDYYATSIYFPSFGWTGNKLYINQGDHVYEEISVSAGVHDGGYGWGALAVDFNHDTHLDIAETNGDGSNSGGSFYQEQSYLWMSNGDLTYEEMAVESGLSHFGKGRGMVNFDYDNDGDQDVIIFANNEEVTLYRNDLDLQAADAHWLRVFLDSSADDTVAADGYGAKVYVTIGGTTQMRHVGSTTFLGTNELSAHFGLGTATVVDELRVEWNGTVQTVLENVAADQTLTIALGALCPSDITGDQSVDVADLVEVIVQWGPCGPRCTADVTGDGAVDVADLVQVILDWGDC